MLLLGARAQAEPLAIGEDKTTIFALVIGHNAGDSDEQAPLHYADDDALANAELLQEMAPRAQVVLLTELDAETRALHPKLAVEAPTAEAIQRAMELLNQRMSLSRRQGSRPIFYFFYTGHGDVENNTGYVHIKNSRFSRPDLLALLRSSQAETNHVVVDACKSYFLVFDRGGGVDRQRRTMPLVGDEQKLPANTGVLLSTSAAADSHEWEAFQAGIFSHEVRSALRGAADLDQDGRLTYEEVAAFVWSANTSIPVPRFRPDFLDRPPGDAQPAVSVFATTAASTTAATSRLVVGPGASGHQFVEDGSGRRLVDFHPGPRTRLTLLLPVRRPLFLKWPETRTEVELPQGSPLDLTTLLAQNKPIASPVRARGAEHLAFTHILASAFEESTLVVYRQQLERGGKKTPAERDWTWTRRGIVIGAIAAGVLGGAMTFAALHERDQSGAGTTGVTRSNINHRIDLYNRIAVTSYVLSGVGLATFATWTLWPSTRASLDVLPEGGLSAHFEAKLP